MIVTINYNKIESFFIQEYKRLLPHKEAVTNVFKDIECISKVEYIEFYDALTGYHLARFEELMTKKAGYKKRATTANFHNTAKRLFILYLYVFEKYHSFKLQYNMQSDNFKHFLELVELI